MECGAELRLNPKLAGTAVSCPQCGERVRVPKGVAEVPAARRAKPRLQLEEPDPQPAPPQPPKPGRRPEPFTFWMMAAQSVLFVLAGACVWGAIRIGGWEPPTWSLFAEHSFALLGAAVAFIFTGFMLRYWPVIMSLLAVLLACGGIYLGDHFGGHPIDASRTIALALTLLAVWLALEHRKSVTS